MIGKIKWLPLALAATPASAAAAATKDSKNLADYSQAAVGLFGNMRTPAALIGGAVISIGILSAPPISKDDPKSVKVMKRGTMILAVLTLLSEILAVTYSSIAINKLAEIKSPKTNCVAELIAESHELAWLGTNVHFLAGLMGFALIVGLRVHSKYGNPTGKVAICWSVAAFLQALSIVNRGIAMGDGSGQEKEGGDSSNPSGFFASNMLTLTLRYITLVISNALGGDICAIGAFAVACVAGFQTVTTLVFNNESEENKSNKED